MAYISEALRSEVTQRARGLCEYCQTAQLIVVTMEIDHVIPVSAGGTTTIDNLCFTCRGCNGFKLDAQTALDAQTSQVVPLYHPRLERWADHFVWSEDGLHVIGKTASGRATIDRLRMNRDGVVAARRRWVSAGWHPPDMD